MSEFCKECFLKLFGPADDDEEIIESWPYEDCEKWTPIVEIIQKDNKND